MANFAARKRNNYLNGKHAIGLPPHAALLLSARRRTQNWLRTALFAALPLSAFACGLSQPVWADTQGSAGGLTTGAGVLQVMGFLNTGYVQPNSTATPPTFIDYSGTSYGYIRNDYIGVVQGYDGTYSVSYPTPEPSLSHQVGGFISFGNTRGSLTSNRDDLGALNGFNFSDSLFIYPAGSGGPPPGQPSGYGVWPLASGWTSSTISINSQYGYDYSAYTRAQVDNTIIQRVGATAATALQAPIYIVAPPSNTNGNNPGVISGILQSKYQLLAGTGAGTGAGGTGIGGTGTANLGVVLTQELSLYRSTCRVRWVISNADSVSHQVTLRFNVNIRGSDNGGGPTSGNQFYPNSGFYFQDPDRGVSNQVTLLTQVPDQLTVYGKRYETDNATSTIPNPFTGTVISSPPFAARHIFRGFGATPPSQVYVTNPAELLYNSGGFAPSPTGLGNVPLLNNGIATASYFGPYTIQPGGSQEVITYYGNGAPTELLNDDFVTATEATESLGFDSAAALRAGVAGNVTATPQTVGAQFLSPNPFTIFGGIYNRVQANPLVNVNLTNVSAALVLPQGLKLGNLPRSDASAPLVQDTAKKTLGTNGLVAADKDATTSWLVAPTGDVYGALPYQMTVSTAEFGSRTVSRTINVPATPLHPVTASAFQMIGFPFQFDPLLSNNGDPSTVVNGLTSPVDEPVAFYQWIPDATSTTGENGRYELVTQLRPGISYYYRPNLNRTIYAKGVQPVPGQAGIEDNSAFLTTQTVSTIQQVQINLNRGWNMISNPYLYEIPLNYLRFVPREGNTNADSQTFSQAVGNGLVRGGVFFYNTTSKTYDFFDQITSPLTPWQGYWLFTNSPIALVYTLPTQRQSVVLQQPGTPPTEPPTRKRVLGALASGRALGTKFSTDNWKLQITALKSDGTGDRATIVGVSPTAKETNDAAQNLLKPPPPVSDYVYAGLVRPGTTTRYAQDIRRAGGGTKTWDLEVTGDDSGPVTLQWPGTASLPKRVGLTLKDMATGRTVSLRGASSYSINVKAGQLSRFQIISKPVNSQSLNLSNVQVVSGGKAQASGGFALAFDVNQDAEVSAVIKTLGGKTVATVASSKAVSLGHGQLRWNGRAQDGSALPAGPYKAELTARKEGETPVTRIVTIQSLR